MKVKAKIRFLDKKLNEVIEEGTIYEVDKEQGKYLLSRDFVTEVKEEQKKEKQDGKRQNL